MKRYRVSLRGSNLLLSVDGEHRRCGFTAERCLRAASPEEAGKTALILVRQSPLLQEQQQEQFGQGLQLEIEEVREIGWLAFQRGRNNRHLEFFSEEEEGAA